MTTETRLYRIGPEPADVAVSVAGRWLNLSRGEYVEDWEVEDWQHIIVQPTGRKRANRIDPPGCGCTDCLTGWSRPWDEASSGEQAAMLLGRVQDATGGMR